VVFLSLLVISERFWPEGGGGTLATYLITKLLATCNFRTTVVTGTRHPARINGVGFIVDETFRIPSKPARWLYFLTPTMRRRYKDLMRRFDIIYIPFGYQLISIAKDLDKRVIVHLHDYQAVAYNSTILPGHQKGLMQDVKAELNFELLEHGSIKRAMAGSLLVPMTVLCRNWVSKADVVICVSRRQAEIISDRAPELARKIRVVYNPLPETPPLEEKFVDPTFTFAGGGSYVKGFHVLIRAAVNVMRRRNYASFLLAGGFKRAHEALVMRLNNIFRERFRLLGRLPHEDVLKIFSKSYAVLVPSICEEPSPYAVLEAMLMGTLPIASRVGGIPEIVKGTYAERLMFTPGRHEEIADRMETVLSLSRDQLVDVGLKLREVTLKRFDNEEVKQRLLEVFSV
jgi:glycosyltransferase involved in cell wall biosynthesis